MEDEWLPSSTHSGKSQSRSYLQAVYEEDLVHRQPGVTETLTASEAAFPVTRKWLADEVDGVCGETGAIHSPTSFTRIIIGDLKPGILKEVGCMHGREQLCRCGVDLVSSSFCPPHILSQWNCTFIWGCIGDTHTYLQQHFEAQ